LVMLTQEYGLQHVQVRSYLVSAHNFPPSALQDSVVVVVVLVEVVVVVDVVDAVVVVVDVVVVDVVVVLVVVVVVVVVVAVVVVVVVVVDVVVVVVPAEHFPETQLSPDAQVPCLFPHRPFSGRGSEN